MEAVQVIRDDGQPGTVVKRLATAGEGLQLLVAFADGSRVVGPEEMLIAQPDGTYHSGLNQTAMVNQVATELVGDEPLVVPVVA